MSDGDGDGEGYSGMFYLMLILGIIGVLGFLAVLAGAGWRASGTPT